MGVEDNPDTAVSYTHLKETASDPMTAQEKLLVSACELFYTQIKSELTANDPGDFCLLYTSADKRRMPE